MERTLREELEDFIMKFNREGQPSQEHKEVIFWQLTDFQLWVQNQKSHNTFRWLDYQPVGQCIPGTKIIAFKVPLKLSICRSSLSEADWFTPAILLEKQPRLKTVIDLTNTHRYYNAYEEFGTKGVGHVKILVEGRGTIPTDSQLRRFFEAMDDHMEKYANTDALIGVHCTHGLNRTGYFVCRWLVDRLKTDPDEAIRRFNQSRGHNIERQHLVDHIKTIYFSSINRPLGNPALPHPSRRTEYISPLDNSMYDEPSSSSRYDRRNRGKRKRDRGGGERSDNHHENWRIRRPEDDIFNRNKRHKKHQEIVG